MKCIGRTDFDHFHSPPPLPKKRGKRKIYCGKLSKVPLTRYSLAHSFGNFFEIECSWSELCVFMCKKVPQKFLLTEKCTAICKRLKNSAYIGYSLRLRNSASIFTAELLAIFHCLMETIVSGPLLQSPLHRNQH